MAILANRSRISGPWHKFIRFISSLFKKSLAFCLVLLSIQLLYFSPVTSKRISNITLEVLGNLMSTTIPIYDEIIEKINQLTSTVNYFKDLEMENTRLKLELAELVKIQKLNDQTRIENAQLKTLLPVIEDNKFQVLVTRLLSMSMNPFSKNTLIGVGSSNGVEVGQIVTSSEGLIGRIVEVSDHYSKVMLTTDYNSHIPVITSMSRERGILVGNGNTLNLLYLNDNHNVQHNETLITSGDGVVYPYGIAVAKVTSVSKNNIVAKSIIDYSKVEFVIVQSTPHN